MPIGFAAIQMLGSRRLAEDERPAVVENTLDLWREHFDEDDEILQALIGKGAVLAVSPDGRVKLYNSRKEAESDLGSSLDELPRRTEKGSEPPIEEEPAEEDTEEEDDYRHPEVEAPPRGDEPAETHDLPAAELWQMAGFEDPYERLSEATGRTVDEPGLAGLMAEALNTKARQQVAWADGSQVRISVEQWPAVRSYLSTAKESAGTRKEIEYIVSPTAEPPVQPEKPSAGQPRPGKQVPKARPQRGDLAGLAREALPMLGELAAIRGSIQNQTEFAIEPNRISNAADAMRRIISGSQRRAARPEAREYSPGRDDPMIRRLADVLSDILEHRSELEDLYVGSAAIHFMYQDLDRFLAEHRDAPPARIQHASCDVLKLRPIAGGVPVHDESRIKKIALDVIQKQALQLSKGNLQASSGGRLTIDPGFYNCPVVRQVIRELESKSGDPEELRRRLDDLGMIVTQGDHGTLTVYCFVRTSDEGGPKTRICQWFNSAHGNDGKFKIECDKD